MSEENSVKNPATHLLRLSVFLVLFGAFSPSAFAVLSVQVDSPAPGTEFDAGGIIPAVASFSNAVYGVSTFRIQLRNSDNGVEDGLTKTYGSPSYKRFDTWTVDLTIPESASPGETFYVYAEATDPIDGTMSESVAITIKEPPDTTAPTYAGAAGIVIATRVSGAAAADLTWNEAQDDATSAANIIYNVYYAATQGAVFSGDPATFFTGTTSGQVTGLDPKTHYFFGVRAEDEAGNEETNTNTALARYTPQPENGKIEEKFDRAAGDSLVLDNEQASSETTGTAVTSLFVWGGYCAGTTSGTLRLSSSGLLFSGDGKSTGSYAYTCFGKPSLPGGANNIPEVMLDMSGGLARADVKLGALTGLAYDVGSTVSLMIRDESGWWQSGGKALLETTSSTITAFRFAGADAVSWRALSDTSDVDEVDDGGETALTAGTPGAPNLGHVEGMGVRILEPTASAAPLVIRSLTLYGPGPTATDRRYWVLYE